MTGLPVLGRRMTGVEVIPISGATWPHAAIVGRGLAGFESGDVPEAGAGVGVVGVDGVVLGDDNQQIVDDAGDGDGGQVERLGVDQAVGGDGEELAESC